MNQFVEDECSVMVAIKLLGREWIPKLIFEFLSQRELLLF